jgi:hypothetical protein
LPALMPEAQSLPGAHAAMSIPIGHAWHARELKFSLAGQRA